MVLSRVLKKKHIDFPDMPCMKKGLQKQKGDGPLVSSKEEIALLVPLINRG